MSAFRQATENGRAFAGLQRNNGGVIIPSVRVIPIPSGLWRCVERPIGAVVGPLILASGLSAQTAPVPTLPLPPQAPPGTGATPKTPVTGASATDTAAPAQWDYGLGVGVGYDSNIDFRMPDGPSSWALTPRGNVARLFRSPQGQLRLGGTANWIGYQSQDALSRYNADFSLDGSYRSSVNTTWTVGAAYQLGYSDRSQVLGEQGVMLPLVKTRTSAARLGVVRAVGVQTAVRLQGRFFRTEFNEEDIETFGLSNGQSVRATAGLERRFASRNTAAVEYSLEAAEREGAQAYLTHFGSLQWNYFVTPRSGLLLEAGASYTPESVEAGLERREYFYGGASFTRQVGASTVSLIARREVLPAFGLGVSRAQNRFGLSARIPIRHVWSLLLSGAYRMADVPEGTTDDYGNRNEATLALTRRLGQHFEVSGEGRYRRRGATDVSPEIDQFLAGVFISLVGPSSISGGQSGR